MTIHRDLTLIQDLLELLRAKTRFLERIDSHARSFADRPEETTDLAHLDTWLQKREKLFHTVELAEKRIELISEQILEKKMPIPLSVRALIENEVTRGQTLVQKIREKDEYVVTSIRETQDRLLKQIQEGRSIKEKLRRFRSDSELHRGEELDAKG